MARTLTVAESQRFLAEPHIGVLCVERDGERPPLAVPVWYHYRPGGDLTFFTGTQGRTARKTALLERKRRLSFCVQRPEPPYRYVTAECTLRALDRSPSVEDVHAITSRYLPDDVARDVAVAEATGGSPTFVLFRARPDRWVSFDFADETD
ncbi:pyridoxamine 5'-phosphate oxidase [Prauserella shujinwangii]|uniref:Pyridoxamine 5'-phosphate oxidase n=1 Tax=Prauserella shujinwangii TaxID=1453103 RepID=A0A2T0M0N7_9PSEU|nr:pyridoxamine 5'-phosphate oxidase family protein [Prauserella shujinwangii]PRX50148.1 pyridoxamine 5'-phosphate oxidase [Prauserella shujinwangii]